MMASRSFCCISPCMLWSQVSVVADGGELATHLLIWKLFSRIFSVSQST
jgi:hypothetical protein